MTYSAQDELRRLIRTRTWPLCDVCKRRTSEMYIDLGRLVAVCDTCWERAEDERRFEDEEDCE